MPKLSTLWLFENMKWNITNCSNHSHEIGYYANIIHDFVKYNWAKLIRLRQEIFGIKIHPLWLNLVYNLFLFWLVFEKAEQNITNCSNHSDGVEKWSRKGPLVLGNVWTVITVWGFFDDPSLKFSNYFRNLQRPGIKMNITGKLRGFGPTNQIVNDLHFKPSKIKHQNWSDSNLTIKIGFQLKGSFQFNLSHLKSW